MNDDNFTVLDDMITFLIEIFDDLKFGDNFYSMRVPLTGDKPVYWIIQSNGFIAKELKTKQKIKTYNFVFNYRDIKAKKVDEELDKIEKILNRLTCPKFEHHDVYAFRVSSLPSNDDEDVEKMYKGSIIIEVSIYDDYS